MADAEVCRRNRCRLCLCEDAGALRRTLDDAGLCDKILRHLAIKIEASEKTSSMVCNECIEKVSNWDAFREECIRNQAKFDEDSHSNRSNSPSMHEINPLANISVQIKEEPDVDIDHEFDECHKDTEDARMGSLDQPQVYVKNEPLDDEPMDQEFHEFPPTLSPHPLTTNDFPEIISMTNGDVSPTDAIKAEQRKVLFEQSLSKLSEDKETIINAALTKIEVSYIEKCKAMADMHKTLVCACHNVPHQNLKGLLSHLRALRIWFPVFTCYNCMITFTDRSTFTKHIARCSSQPLHAITKLSNMSNRSELKTRLYQNFKCTICKFMFSFHEDFSRHVDEDHSMARFPLHCPCGRVFAGDAEYKDHVYVSCLVEFYCDICFVTTKTIEEFQKHAVEVHDESEGFILLQDDNYKVRKPSMHTSPVVDEAVILTGKRERKSSIKNSSIDEDDGVPEEPKPTYYTPKTDNRVCPVCCKEYSSYKNMMRHFKTHKSDDHQDMEVDDEDSFYSCPDCGGVFNTLEWKIHLTEKHQNKPCGECGKLFQFQTELDQHRSVHLNLKVYRDSKTDSYKSTMVSPSSEEESPVKEEPLREFDNEDVDVETFDEKKYKCELCSDDFNSYSGLWEHNRVKHPERKTPNADTYPKKCEDCDKVCTTGAALYRHRQIHLKPSYNTSLLKIRKTEIVEEESYHTCKRCFKVFSSKYNLKNHLKCHGINVNPASKKQVKKQEASKQDQPNTDDDEEEETTTPLIFTCDICVMTFSNKIALKKHKEKHMYEFKGFPKANDSICCKLCKVAFSSAAKLAQHMSSEHDQRARKKVNRGVEEEQHACSICAKSFHSAGALTTHIGWHKRGHNEANTKVMKNHPKPAAKPVPAKVKEEPGDHQCATCLAKLPNDTALQVHILEKHRSVSAIMLIPRCNTCNKDFGTQDEYETHKRLHDFLERQKQHEQKAVSLEKVPKQKNYPCKYCNAAFSRSDTLGAHMRQFHKEHIVTEFKCHHCDRIFEKQNSLTIHLKVHEKQKSLVQPVSKPLFSCSICSMGFDLPKDLRAHTISAHPF
ncbi:unnamed protein product [Phyllotreta striolata]|uniref:Uncharacterized protein n=1 Tax=Phyllotreta striolata TaxID=444603 RepID=A0A9N9TYW7_PHYSR|nr:unnamed protein product [Phyllotreta striolata]